MATFLWVSNSHTAMSSVTNGLYFYHMTSPLSHLHNNTLLNNQGVRLFHMHAYCSCWHTAQENEGNVSTPPRCARLPSRPLITPLSPAQKCQPSRWYIASHMLRCLAFKYQCWSTYLSRSFQELGMRRSYEGFKGPVQLQQTAVGHGLQCTKYVKWLIHRNECNCDCKRFILSLHDIQNKIYSYGNTVSAQEALMSQWLGITDFWALLLEQVEFGVFTVSLCAGWSKQRPFRHKVTLLTSAIPLLPLTCVSGSLSGFVLA